MEILKTRKAQCLSDEFKLSVNCKGKAVVTKINDVYTCT